MTFALFTFSQFMEKRDRMVGEQLGAWTITEKKSNKQTDSSSCGVFALMVSFISLYCWSMHPCVGTGD